jgi:antitoxin component of MazEF toxin-antitoxin module
MYVQYTYGTIGGIMVKKLARLGNSRAVIIDRPLMDLLGINDETALKLTVVGRKLTIEPVAESDEDAKFKEIMHRTGRKNAELFRRLAK